LQYEDDLLGELDKLDEQITKLQADARGKIQRFARQLQDVQRAAARGNAALGEFLANRVLNWFSVICANNNLANAQAEKADVERKLMLVREEIPEIRAEKARVKAILIFFFGIYPTDGPEG
jgi:hypothetical protein